MGLGVSLARAGVALGPREASAPLGRSALESPAAAWCKVVGRMHGPLGDRIGVRHGSARLARCAFGDGLRGRACVETQAAAGLVLPLALYRVAQVLYVVPPRADLGLGHAGVAVLFRLLTGLADGLALKELALRVGRRDSPQLWVPRFLTLPRLHANE
jgi:hypothetical protein